MPSITTWQRLEPRTRSTTLGAVRARIHDPAWLLARQRQLGEWAGEDTGSIVRADLGGQTSRLTHFRPGAGPTGPFPAGAPLEAVVEDETDVRAATAGAGFAARAGQCFLRSLGPVLGPRYRAAYVLHVPLGAPAAPVLDALDDGGRALLDLLVGRVPDGHALYVELDAALRPAGGTAGLPAQPAIDPDDVADVTEAAAAWLAWYDAMRPTPRPSAWDPSRLEYRFTVAAARPAGAGSPEIALTAPAFAGGRLDWHDFDVDEGATLGAAAATEAWSATAIPTPVRFPGMPEARWWGFEDGAVNLGSIDAAPDDLGRLALLEFALVYGNDFLYVPVDLDVGSLCWIDTLRLTTTFGETVDVGPIEAEDGPAGAWSMFRLTAPGGTRGDFLLLAPTLGDALHGPVLEEVLLARDEMANVAWAVEERIQTAAGTTAVPHELALDRLRRLPPAPEPAGPPAGRALAYDLATQVPDHWHPLLPVIVTRTLAGVSWNNVALEVGGLHPVQGELLRPPAAGPLRIAEEEVPREGALVSRTWQRSRWTDGSIHTWVERRKRVGRGEGSSGLRYDQVRAAP